MRERLVAALVGTAVAVVVVMAVVRAYALAGEVERSAHATVERSLTMATVAVDERLAGGRPVTPEFLTALSSGVVNIRFRPAGATEAAAVTGGPPVSVTDREFAQSTRRPDGSELTVVRPADDIGRRISDALLPLVVLALGLVLAAAVVGWLLARRLSQPFQQLAVAARALARGSTGVEVPHYGIPEAESVGAALREGLARIDRMHEREQQFAVNASHELRSPITALALRVEGLGLHPSLPDDARAEVAELRRGLDRLSTAVVEVLESARDERDAGAQAVDAAPLLAEAVDRLGSRRVRRRVELAAPGGVLVDVPAESLTEVVEALLDDCVGTGRGTVRVELAHRGTHVEVVVSDEGPARGAPDLVHPDS
ncbi:MAG: HAMP domain-containing histidine kinase, partial [Dermatophilaceae bacterium]|nr:HAMP domain-containing histidine kinase [Dermatophilaceae bacterium]